MELEATILERLQELRRWQAEQQERLLKQQQEQRDLLSSEQDRMYQALGLSVQNIILDDSQARRTSNSFVLSPPKDCQKIFITDTSSGEEYPGSHEALEPIVSRELIANEMMENPSKIELSVPPLQLSTNRYLNFKPAVEGFAGRLEIPRDEDSLPGTPEKIRQRVDDLGLEGVEPLPPDKPLNKFVQLDDLPVPSPKKDFETLLEERLRDCEKNEQVDSERKTDIRLKRPYLRKGEGLARYKPNQGGNSRTRRGRPRSSSLVASTRPAPTTIGARNTPVRLKETPKSSRTSGIHDKAVPPTAQAKLSLKSATRNQARDKSMSILPSKKSCLSKQLRVKQPQSVDMNNSSDIETKNRRELEEMRIFELLEEKAENSSFCSNSSTVLALFRQSTPLKPTRSSATSQNRDFEQQRTTTSVENPRRQEKTSDASLEEIVRSTRSNISVTGSPITKIRETLIQKDYVISNWDERTNENLNTNNTNRLSNCSIAAGTYKTTKHTTFQFNNNNKNNNNNNNNVIDNDESTISSDIEDKMRCGRNVNFTNKYNENDRNTIDKRARSKDSENEGAPDVSLHVRFSEYNEYKTIGLTDTSMMSNESLTSGNYPDDGAWSDRSTSPDSSDVEVLFTNIKRNMCPRSTTTMTTSSAVKGSTSVALRKKGQTPCDEEMTDQTTDDDGEDYTSICSNDGEEEEEESCDEGNTTITEMKVEPTRPTSLDKHKESDRESSDDCNDSGSTIEQENNDENNASLIDSMDIDGNTILKSELLKTRLAELEREIDIFRKENAALATHRKKLNDEARQLERDFKLKEDNLEKERLRNEESMLEEKKRLAREKAALENRLRDARDKSLRSKQERQEINILREQIEELRQDAGQKESRWQAVQARQKSQIRVLQTENARLKQELEKLRASRTNNSRIVRGTAVSSNTRSINRISKQLESKRKITERKESSSEEERTEINHGESEIEKSQTEENDRTSSIDLDGCKTIVYAGLSQRFTKSEDDLRKKRNMYVNLLSEATEGLRGNEEIVLGKSEKTSDKSLDKFRRDGINDQDERSEAASGDSTGQKKFDISADRSYERTTEKYKSPALKNPESTVETTDARSPNGRTFGYNAQRESGSSSDRTISQNERINTATSKQQDIREVQCPDGHLEYWYPNGNVKKIYPDRNVTKMIYYNGDVRECSEDGSVKYFYASTRTWHTTLPDGLEILEFPDGQVERRTKNGTNEVSFPDGSVRLLQADGTEKWVLPDGTVAETFPDGNKVLSFPNGQREVHTNEHKRREYPDGTVKLVYPDGTQETRYSTGRVRVKDKDGNLLMDVHHR